MVLVLSLKYVLFKFVSFWIQNLFVLFNFFHFQSSKKKKFIKKTIFYEVRKYWLFVILEILVICLANIALKLLNNQIWELYMTYSLYYRVSQIISEINLQNFQIIIEKTNQINACKRVNSLQLNFRLIFLWERNLNFEFSVSNDK